MEWTKDIWQYNRDKVKGLTSVMAQHPAARVTDKYSFLSSLEVIDAMGSNGWMIRTAQETNSRKASLSGYQKHIIRFRNPDLSPVGVKDAVFPELCFVNAHTGLDGAEFLGGTFRVVCSNGAVVADALLASFKIIHRGDIDTLVKEAIKYLLNAVPRISSTIADWQNITLTPDEQKLLGFASINYRYAADPERAKRIDLDRLVRPVRGSDSDNNLWNTYNRIQEKLVNGDKLELNGRPARSWSVRHLNKTRGVTGISENIKLNQALWTLADGMAKLKKGEAVAIPTPLA